MTRQIIVRFKGRENMNYYSSNIKQKKLFYHNKKQLNHSQTTKIKPPKAIQMITNIPYKRNIPFREPTPPREYVPAHYQPAVVSRSKIENNPPVYQPQSTWKYRPLGNYSQQYKAEHRGYQRDRSDRIVHTCLEPARGFTPNNRIATTESHSLHDTHLENDNSQLFTIQDLSGRIDSLKLSHHQEVTHKNKIIQKLKEVSGRPQC